MLYTDNIDWYNKLVLFSLYAGVMKRPLKELHLNSVRTKQTVEYFILKQDIVPIYWLHVDLMAKKRLRN
jgi:hypothetical protein